MKNQMLKSAGVASLAVVLTVILLYCWPILQRTVGTQIPEWVYNFTRELARIGLFVSIGTMIQGLVPNMNRFRIGLYMFACMGFLVNLLGDNNSGNVFLEASLSIQMAWSLIGNWHRHEPIVKDGRAWAKGISVMAIAYALGLGATHLWPVTAETQYPGWWWSWLALAGGVSLFIEVNLLETGILKGDTPLYIFVHGVGCALLTASYLGQYNAAGITLNVALVALVLYSFIQAKRRHAKLKLHVPTPEAE